MVNERYEKVKYAAGLQGLTIKDLAEELGYSAGGLYNALQKDSESSWLRIAINRRLNIDEGKK